LLANAVGQLINRVLTHRIREQARSHICSPLFVRTCAEVPKWERSVPFWDRSRFITQPLFLMSHPLFDLHQQRLSMRNQLLQQPLILIHIPFIFRQVAALVA